MGRPTTSTGRNLRIFVDLNDLRMITLSPSEISSYIPTAILIIWYHCHSGAGKTVARASDQTNLDCINTNDLSLFIIHVFYKIIIYKFLCTWSTPF